MNTVPRNAYTHRTTLLNQQAPNMTNIHTVAFLYTLSSYLTSHTAILLDSLTHLVPRGQKEFFNCACAHIHKTIFFCILLQLAAASYLHLNRSQCSLVLSVSCSWIVTISNQMLLIKWHVFLLWYALIVVRWGIRKGWGRSLWCHVLQGLAYCT
jgi:hypothetical protein